MRKRAIETIRKLCGTRPELAFIGSDLSADPALKAFGGQFPERFFMEGISEAHIVGMASGLALEGMIPFVNTIATFLTRRCFEQNVIDLGMAGAKVRLLGGGGGLVYAPLGPTHLALDDLALMRAIPGMTVVCPADADEMERSILGSVDLHGPVYLRVAKGGEKVVSRPEHPFQIGKAILHRPLSPIMLVTTGTLLQTALAVADRLQAAGNLAGVLHCHTVKPLDEATILAALQGSKLLLTLEEHSLIGGLGSAVAEILAEWPGRRPVFKRVAVADEFPAEYGSQDSLRALYGLDESSISALVLELLKQTRSS